MSTFMQFVDRPMTFDVVGEERRFVATTAAAYPDLEQLIAHFRRRPLVALTEADVREIARSVRPEWFVTAHREESPDGAQGNSSSSGDMDDAVGHWRRSTPRA